MRIKPISRKSAKKLARAIPPQPFIPIAAKPKKVIPVKSKKSKTESSLSSPKPQSFASKVYHRTQDAIEQGEPHFRVGGKEVYFPQGRVILLRPNAKHTPYQAKFIVPKSFNKLDLRDYLYHLYGLRALNVTTQLLWARWTRETPRSPRYRMPQIKKMTIEMEDPFVWPEEPKQKSIENKYQVSIVSELKAYAEDVNRFGSDRLKPPKAFGGIVGPFPPAPGPFIPRSSKNQLTNKKVKAEASYAQQSALNRVRDYLGL